ncbi:DUF2290 domain-containing protein [Atlantibacter hermannii]|uniref:DUF2290 domain-containing protein n=1 Tax=Atlantibacter hermannii TaxID=565 RepID=UPI0028B12CD1|nr:DUF2290 domain-containing protein [Atlantibacter hermannii]
MNSNSICSAIRKITSHLISVGISDAQNFPVITQDREYCYVNYSGFADASIALRNIEYADIYNFLDENRQYNIKLLDGGLLHLLFQFDHRMNLVKERLCYFPAPNYESFQNDPDLYLDESNFYADIVQKSILPVPIRVDYAPTDANDVIHPAAHLTLGQFKNCRIPLSSPLCPVTFVKFILSSFYNTAYHDFGFEMERLIHPNTITVRERGMLHFSIE